MDPPAEVQRELERGCEKTPALAEHFMPVQAGMSKKAMIS